MTANDAARPGKGALVEGEGDPFASGGEPAKTEARRAFEVAVRAFQEVEQQRAEIWDIKRQFAELRASEESPPLVRHVTWQERYVAIEQASRARKGTGLGRLVAQGICLGFLLVSILAIAAGLHLGLFWDLVLPGCFGCVSFGVTLAAVSRSGLCPG